MDLRFNDMAESFNEQQKHYEAMVEHIRKLKQISGSTNVDNLAFAECIGKIRIEHKMKGYDFSLVTNPIGPEGENEEKPLCLQSAQSEVMGLSDRAKATISKGTALIQLIDWLLRGHSQMAEQVKGAAENYQEEGRLCDNLEENMKEVRRAKELSQRYRQQAGEVYNEAA
uniref:Si:ch73-345f18.3 n=1 Tax=Cyprinodon variegatus TaxID=28743 RepID=A0A3Q2CZH0_CYPVA